MRVVTEENCLKNKCPEILHEWNYEKNQVLTPETVSYGSAKKAWWVCSKGHEWEATINSRTSVESGCPYCSGKRVTKDTCLTATHPLLASEWHPTKNGNLTPNDVSKGTNKKAWWKCSKNEEHEWNAYIFGRSQGRGCPYCAGRGKEEEYWFTKK